MGPASDFARPTQVRFTVLVLLCTLCVVLYLDRICIAQAALSMQKDLHLDNTQMGYVFAAFMLSYGLFEVPTGRMGDRYGSRKVLMRIVLWWSAFTAITGFVPLFSVSSRLLIDSLGLLLLVRFLFGVGEAGALPNMARVVAHWFPADRRGPAQGLLNTAMLVGGATAPVLAAYLIKVIGWRLTFSVFAGAGVVWVIVFQRLFRDNPADHPGVNEAERRLIEGRTASANTAPSMATGRIEKKPENAGITEAPASWATSTGRDKPKEIPDLQEMADPAVESHASHPPIPWRRVLGSANVWLLGGLMTCLASVTYFVYSWYPNYLQAGRGVGELDSGWLASMVMGFGAVGSTAGGFLCDALVRRTGERPWTLRLVGVVALLFASAAVWSSTTCDSAILASALMGMTVLMIGVQITAWWAVVTAISGKHLGALFGLMNSMGVVGAISSQVLVGRYVDWRKGLGYSSRAQWDPAFTVYALVLLVGALAWLFIDASRSAVNAPTQTPEA